MGIKYLDAKRFKIVLIGGSKWVKKHEDILNELNVYPVPDGDTGSNMSMTLESMANDIEEHTTDTTTMYELLEVIENAVFMGARGNSGTILSQIIAGFLKGIAGKDKLLANDIIVGFEKASEQAYKVVPTPVEGTILTVIRRVAEVTRENYDKINDLTELLRLVKDTADEAVEDTPNLLPKLKEAGVVDAGGKGLFYFFEGFYKVTTELTILEELKKSEVKESEFDGRLVRIDHDPASINFKYCTEYIINSADFDVDNYKRQILEIGDSAVFAQTSKKVKTHIHTNDPGKALEIAASHGDLDKIKIDNMKLQHEKVNKDSSILYMNKKENKNKNGYILVADSDKLKDEFLKLGADIVIFGGQSKNPSVQDILDAINKLKKENIFIMPNNKNIITTAKLAAEKSNKNIIVHETKTMLEGHFLLENKGMEISQVLSEEKRNYSIEITKAVRETKADSLDIKKDDYLGLVNGKIKFVNENLQKLIDEMLNELASDNSVKATVVEGKEKDESTSELIKEKLKNIKTKYITEGQDNYDYYIYVENRDPNMPEIAIVSDSICDMSAEDLAGLPVYIVPLKVDLNGEFLRDGVEVSTDTFWKELLEEGSKVKTSQPSPQEIMDIYDKLFDKGYRKIISIHGSSKTTGTIQAAKIAKASSKRPNDVELVDSQGLSILEGAQVFEAGKKAANKASYNEIMNTIHNIRDRSKLLLVVNDLKYIERGGRISKSAAAAGGILHVKPILTMSKGEVITDKKVFGEKGALKYLEKFIKDESKHQTINVITGWGGTSEELEMINKLISAFNGNPRVKFPVSNRQIGAVIGTHTGPAFGIAVYPKLK